MFVNCPNVCWSKDSYFAVGDKQFDLLVCTHTTGVWGTLAIPWGALIHEGQIWKVFCMDLFWGQLASCAKFQERFLNETTHDYQTVGNDTSQRKLARVLHCT